MINFVTKMFLQNKYALNIIQVKNLKSAYCNKSFKWHCGRHTPIWNKLETRFLNMNDFWSLVLCFLELTKNWTDLAMISQQIGVAPQF